MKSFLNLFFLFLSSQLDEVDASRLLNEDVVLSSSTGECNDSPASTEPVGQDLILASPESER